MNDLMKDLLIKNISKEQLLKTIENLQGEQQGYQDTQDRQTNILQDRTKEISDLRCELNVEHGYYKKSQRRVAKLYDMILRIASTYNDFESGSINKVGKILEDEFDFEEGKAVLDKTLL